MADYIKEIGGNTRLMIREGPGPSQFQFFMQTGRNTYNHRQKWSWGLRQDGGPNWFNTRELEFRLETGGRWQFMGWIEDMGGLEGSIVDLRLSVVGAGLGFPTSDFFLTLDYRTGPPPPRPPTIHAVTATSIEVGWGGDGGSGGALITGREIWASPDHNPRHIISPAGARTTVHGLLPGTWYYFWARNSNEKGISGFSERTDRHTLRIPDPPNPVTFHEIKQTSVRTVFTYDRRWDGGTPIREFQVGYGLGPNAPVLFSGSTGRNHFLNLSPGRRYYFWVRARNDVGWSNWSSRSEVLLRAGAYVKVAGVWRRALVHRKVNGVWKLTHPMVKLDGYWRETL